MPFSACTSFQDVAGGSKRAPLGEYVRRRADLASRAPAPEPAGPSDRPHGATILLVLLALFVARSFLAALAWAAVIAITAWPVYTRFAGVISRNRAPVLDRSFSRR